jgi:hypothetical protein
MISGSGSHRCMRVANYDEQDGYRAVRLAMEYAEIYRLQT